MNDEHECPLKDDEIICTSNSVSLPKPSQKEHGKHKLGKQRDLGSSSMAQIPATTVHMTDNVQSTIVSCSNKRDLEAKKRLSRRLKNVEKRENLSRKESPRTLKRILSSPKHDCVVSSCPKMETELHMSSFSTSAFQLFTEDNSLQPNDKDVSAKQNYMRPNEALKTLKSNGKILETGLLTEDLSSDACQKNWKVNNTIQSVSVNLSETPSKENNAHSTIAEEGNTAKTRQRYQYLKCSTQDVYLENKTITSSAEVPSSNPVSKYKVELQERFDDTEEHISPVSVLDSLFSEDVTSPSSKINNLAKPQVEPFHANFEEKSVEVDHIDHKLNICSCIRTVLQASELNWKELSENSRSSGQLLNLFSVDRRDLFADFLNDVLLEVSQHNVECITWASFIRPDTQAFSVLGKDVVEEVMKEVQWYLVPSMLPRKLEHIVEKDMEKPQCWIGMRRDTEDIVIQIVDDVLDESIIETIFSLEE
ncbi:hypothetical protein AgCh_023653 [Apium graveolens]